MFVSFTLLIEKLLDEMVRESYIIDVKRKKISTHKSLLSFFLLYDIFT